MMKRMRAVWCALAFLLPAYGTSQPVDRHILPGCEATPGIRTSHYPGFSNVLTSNQIAQPPGKSLPADGQHVYVFGRVFDRDCVPVSEAKVELWQADPQGRHRYATKAALATPDPVFAGSGRATTDNLGQFRFFTLYPGPYSYWVTGENDQRYRIKRGPHVNLRVSHPDLRRFHTNLFFEGDHRNATDHRYKRLSDEAKQRVLMRVEPYQGDMNRGLQVFIDIVLPRRAPFRKY